MVDQTLPVDFSTPIMPSPALRLPRPAQVLSKLRAARKPAAAPARSPLPGVLTAFDLTAQSEIVVLEGALRNETWLVRTLQDRKVLKRYKPTVDRQQILHEHSILKRLEELGFPAPRLARMPGGETIYTHSQRHYAIFDYLEGYFRFDSYLYLPPRSGWFLHAAGQLLAQLHEALRDFNPQGRNPNGFIGYHLGRYGEMEWYLETLREVRQDSCSTQAAFSEAARQPIIQTLCKRAAWLEERACALERTLEDAPLQRRLVHGDYGPYNLMVRPGAPMVVLDFELARIDWRLVDLVSAISTTIGPSGEVDPGKVNRILQGYQSVCPIPAAELRWLPQVWQYQILRRLIICWRQYLDSSKPALLEEAQKRLDRLDWLDSNPEVLAPHRLIPGG